MTRSATADTPAASRAGDLTRDRSQLGWDAIRADFPVLSQSIDGHRLAYLDNAASTQMPRPVLDRIVWYQTTEHSNIHRGVHTLSQRATESYEQARQTIAGFVGAPEPAECIFVRGTTEATNLVATSWGRMHVGEGDEIVISAMEHHANIVPWQLLCRAVGARLRIAPITDDGELVMDALAELIGERTRLVAMNHVSNALGTINPVREITQMAHAHGALMLVDGAQAVAHMPVDVEAIGCDFYAFSGHKMCGPTGVGVLWGKRAHLEAMDPYQAGGDMIRRVSFEETTFASIPNKFEAGTPNIMGVIGLGAAAEYLQSIGLERIGAREHELLAYATERLSAVDGVRIIGTAEHKAAVISFEVDGVHPHDVGTILDSEGVAIRAGHHCAQPLMDRLGVPATARASLAFYNTREDVDQLVAALGTVREIFG